MKQTEGKPDKTRADKQKEQAGARATFGLRNTTKAQPITAFVLDAALSNFPKNLLSIGNFYDFCNGTFLLSHYRNT